MGSGKSTIGRLLAKKLHRPFVDTDQIAVATAGMSIQSLFDKKGEEYFRDLESRIILCLSQEKPSVISLGGGAVLRAVNRELLKKGIWVNLMTSTAVLNQRLSRGYQRPLLKGVDIEKKITDLYRQRFPYYSMAPYQVDNSGLSKQAAMEEVVRIIISKRKKLVPKQKVLRSVIPAT